MAEQVAAGSRVLLRIWDLPSRVTHWLMAILIPFSWWSATYDHLQWHRLSGYFLLSLLVFRLAWGVFGSDTARFGRFLRGPQAVLAYLRGSGSRGVGHNPLGGWSVTAMLLMLGVQIGLGLFAVDEDGLDPSPLARFVSFETGRAIAKLHHLTVYVLLSLIALHLAAIAFYAVKGQNLVGPMVTGRGRFEFGMTPPRFAPTWLVFVAMTFAALLAWFLARGLSI